MISVNSEKCIGCGLCTTTCPEVFKLNDTTFKAEVISQETNNCDIKKAIDGCPVGAISQ